MSQGLKNIQTAARSCARRERILNPNMADPSHLNYEGYHLGDTGSGYANEAELDESGQPEEEYDSGTLSRLNLEVEGLMVHDHYQRHTERPFILKKGPHEHNENASPIAPRGSSASACDSKYTKHDASAEYLVDATKGTRMKNVSVPSLQGDVASFPKASMNSSSSSATPPSSTQNRVPKRDLDRDGGKEENERPRKRPAKDSSDQLLESRIQQRLPCPFRIYDSTLFKKNTGIDTCGGTWPDIAKLK